MSVRHQATPNPNAVKFVVEGRRLTEGRPLSFSSLEEAETNELARAVLALDGVANVFMVNDFVTVTKTGAADWVELIPRIEAAIVERL